MLSLHLEIQGLHLEFYMKEIDFLLIGGYLVFRPAPHPSPSLLPPRLQIREGWLFLYSICIGIHPTVALIKRPRPKVSCSDSHIFPFDSILVPYNLVSRLWAHPAFSLYTSGQPLAHSNFILNITPSTNISEIQLLQTQSLGQVAGCSEFVTPGPEIPRNPKSTHSLVPRIEEFWSFVPLSERDFDWQSQR